MTALLLEATNGHTEEVVSQLIAADAVWKQSTPLSLDVDFDNQVVERFITEFKRKHKLFDGEESIFLVEPSDSI